MVIAVLIEVRAEPGGHSFPGSGQWLRKALDAGHIWRESRVRWEVGFERFDAIAL